METNPKQHSQKAWEWWGKFGKNPICLAPMAEISDLPWRIFMRRHNIKVCYTGMMNAAQWSQGTRYQDKMFNTCEEDRPLIAQIAGQNHDEIIKAAKDLSKYCDAIDINLGCTQRIACRGGYGYFMVDTQQKREKTLELFRKLTQEVNVPICAKIRIFIDDNGELSEQRTLDFAKALEDCGVSLIQVHGRVEHRNKKAEVLTDVIKHIVETVSIPVIANGGITCIEDAEKIIKETGAAGVSVASAVLKDPTAFDPEHHQTKQENAMEYLNIALEHKVRFYGQQKHIFQLYEDDIKADPSLAPMIKQTETLEQLIDFVKNHK